LRKRREGTNDFEKPSFVLAQIVLKERRTKGCLRERKLKEMQEKVGERVSRESDEDRELTDSGKSKLRRDRFDQVTLLRY